MQEHNISEQKARTIELQSRVCPWDCTISLVDVERETYAAWHATSGEVWSKATWKLAEQKSEVVE